MPELFNGTEVTTIAGDERISFNKQGVAGSKNMTVANFTAQVQGSTPLKGDITNANLNAGDNYSYAITHNKNSLYVGVALYNNLGAQENTVGLFVISNSNTVKFTFNGPITGTWRYILTFF